MSLFDKPWDVSQVPRLDIVAGAAVDIGFLGGDEHQAAFRSLLRKVAADNPQLASWTLARIDSHRPVNVQLPATLTDDATGPLADALYNSRNESVFLVFTEGGVEHRVGVHFDNPEFWLDDSSA